MSDFKITAENENKLTLVEAKFILEQGEKVLKETGDQSQVIVARTTTLITLISGLIVALIAYVIKDFFFVDATNSAFLDSLIVTLIYLFIICMMMIANITGKDYGQLGSNPKSILINDFFAAPSEKRREVCFFITEFKRCQEKIEHNKELNTERWRKFKLHLWLTVLTPIAFIVIYLIALFIMRLF